jgi:hypothetical protein
MRWRDTVVFPIVRDGKITWPDEATDEDKKAFAQVMATLLSADFVSLYAEPDQ